MNENNLEEYCKEHSIRMSCRVCNRPVFSKVEMDLVSPSDDAYRNIYYCKLSQIIEEESEIFICQPCSSVIYRCAYGIHQMKHGFILRGEKRLNCTVCKGSNGIKQLYIEKESEKYEVLVQLVGKFVIVETSMWICNACDDLLQDLFELHHTISNTTSDIQATVASERPPDAKIRVATTKPIDIPKPRIRLPAFQTSRNSETEVEVQVKETVKNIFLPRACLHTDDILLSSKHIDLNTYKPEKLFSPLGNNFNTINQGWSKMSNTSEKQLPNQTLKYEDIGVDCFNENDDCEQIKKPVLWSVLSNQSMIINTKSSCSKLENLQSETLQTSRNPVKEEREMIKNIFLPRAFLHVDDTSLEQKDANTYQTRTDILESSIPRWKINNAEEELIDSNQGWSKSSNTSGKQLQNKDVFKADSFNDDDDDWEQIKKPVLWSVLSNKSIIINTKSSCSKLENLQTKTLEASRNPVKEEAKEMVTNIFLPRAFLHVDDTSLEHTDVNTYRSKTDILESSTPRWKTNNPGEEIIGSNQGWSKSSNTSGKQLQIEGVFKMDPFDEDDDDFEQI